MRPPVYGALAGIAGAAAVLGASELVAAATEPRSAPLAAVGGVVVDIVPETVKEFGVRVFYTYDKVALQIGTGVLLAVVGAAVGVIAVRRLSYGLAGVALFGVLGVVAALTRAGATWVYPLPSVVGAIAGGGVLLLALHRLPDAAAGDVAAPQVLPGDWAPDRRRFLVLAGGALGAGIAAAFAGRWLGASRGVRAARAAVLLPAPVSPAGPLPVGVDQRLPQLTPFVTSARHFYLVDTALIVPQVDPTTWRLRVHGRVRRPLTVTYAQLLARPTIERYLTLACVSNEVGGSLIGNAKWLGVPVKDLLDEAEPDAGADQVVSRSVDGFTAGTPTAVLRDGRDALLAVGMNGQPLPVQHGFPVRMIVPGLYGYVSATKWLAELELTSFADFDAYWVRRGWAAQAPIKTQSRIDTPVGGAKLIPGPVVVAGVAWAQHRGISAVEVQINEGAWQPAQLAAVPSIDTWRQWSLRWQATPGKYRVQVRAVDSAGDLQPETRTAPFPSGATGWHSIHLTVRGS